MVNGMGNQMACFQQQQPLQVPFQQQQETQFQRPYQGYQGYMDDLAQQQQQPRGMLFESHRAQHGYCTAAVPQLTHQLLLRADGIVGGINPPSAEAFVQLLRDCSQVLAAAGAAIAVQQHVLSEHVPEHDVPSCVGPHHLWDLDHNRTVEDNPQICIHRDVEPQVEGYVHPSNHQKHDRAHVHVCLRAAGEAAAASGSLVVADLTVEDAVQASKSSEDDQVLAVPTASDADYTIEELQLHTNATAVAAAAARTVENTVKCLTADPSLEGGSEINAAADTVQNTVEATSTVEAYGSIEGGRQAGEVLASNTAAEVEALARYFCAVPRSTAADHIAELQLQTKSHATAVATAECAAHSDDATAAAAVAMGLGGAGTPAADGFVANDARLCATTCTYAAIGGAFAAIAATNAGSPTKAATNAAVGEAVAATAADAAANADTHAAHRAATPAATNKGTHTKAAAGEAVASIATDAATDSANRAAADTATGEAVEVAGAPANAARESGAAAAAANAVGEEPCAAATDSAPGTPANGAAASTARCEAAEIVDVPAHATTGTAVGEAGPLAGTCNASEDAGGPESKQQRSPALRSLESADVDTSSVPLHDIMQDLADVLRAVDDLSTHAARSTQHIEPDASHTHETQNPNFCCGPGPPNKATDANDIVGTAVQSPSVAEQLCCVGQERTWEGLPPNWWVPVRAAAPPAAPPVVYGVIPPPPPPVIIIPLRQQQQQQQQVSQYIQDGEAQQQQMHMLACGNTAAAAAGASNCEDYQDAEHHDDTTTDQMHNTNSGVVEWCMDGCVPDHILEPETETIEELFGRDARERQELEACAVSV